MNHPDRINILISDLNSNRNGKYRKSRRNSPCPICGRTKDTDCRWNDEIVLCHSYIDVDAEVEGYIYRGSKDIWGLYYPKEATNGHKPIRPRQTREFFYPDANGNRLVKVTRIDNGKGSKKFYQSHWDGKTWVKTVPNNIKSQLHLYRVADPINQQAIASGNPLLIVEGEGKVDLLLDMGIAATSSIGGAGNWRKHGYPNYLEDLAGANVVLCPDRNKPGLSHCEDIARDLPNAQWLYPFPDSPLWEHLPEKEGLDIADWIAEGATREQILGAIGVRRELTSQISGEDEERQPKTIAEMLLAIASSATYFHTPDGQAYADVTVDGHRETYPVNSKSKQFREWLRFNLYKQYGKTSRSEALKIVLETLEAKTKYEGEEKPVCLRLAEYQGKIYLDLGDPDWRAVEISEQGWQIVSDYPVRFRRNRGMKPLCLPERGGNVSELKQVLNLADEDWVLVLSWLSFCFYPAYPHPVLILHGERGSGKSFTAQILKSLIDPSLPPLQAESKDLQDLSIAAHNRWLLCFDNLSNISSWLSDALCRIATGGGFATRTLYENEEETIFEFTRPIILTGIDSLATRGDLLERSILINLPHIPEEQRLTEEVLSTKLEQIKPRVLGAILTAVSQTLKAPPTTTPGRLPRMADFAKWAIAGESALGLAPGSFLLTYGDNRSTAHEAALETSPVAMAIQSLMENCQSWQGTAKDLLAELEKLLPEKTIASRHWSSNLSHLSKTLARLAPDLRIIGIEFTSKKIHGKKIIEVKSRNFSDTLDTQIAKTFARTGFLGCR